MNFLRLILLLLTAVLMMPAGAQNERAAGTIGSRDSVSIQVFREDDLTTRGQLSPAGTINVPLIGAVRIAGLTTDQAARLIEGKLRDGYLVRPEVSVAITARVRKSVTVLGEVQKPGVFRLDPNRQLTLVEAIGMAGGMSRIANEKKIMLKRRGQAKTIRIDLRGITSGESKDIPLLDGDIVTVPESLF